MPKYNVWIHELGVWRSGTPLKDSGAGADADKVEATKMSRRGPREKGGDDDCPTLPGREGDREIASEEPNALIS
jgi:hypothetical protein